MVRLSEESSASGGDRKVLVVDRDIAHVLSSLRANVLKEGLQASHVSELKVVRVEEFRHGIPVNLLVHREECEKVLHARHSEGVMGAAIPDGNLLVVGLKRFVTHEQTEDRALKDQAVDL
jgi:hypothetical protein